MSKHNPNTIHVTGVGVGRWVTYPPLKDHLDGCTQPGMLWQESIRGLPLLGQCPDCGALSYRRGAKKTAGRKPVRRGGRRAVAA